MRISHAHLFMQDIHKDEILEKLIAGWKVRRKGWTDTNFINRTDSIDRLMQWYQYDDWEAESPDPICKSSDLRVNSAFYRLKVDPVKYIRRTSWPEHMLIRPGGDHVQLNTDDILATDWEVWG